MDKDYQHSRIERFISRAAIGIKFGRSEDELYQLFLEDGFASDLSYLSVMAGKILLSDRLSQDSA